MKDDNVPATCITRRINTLRGQHKSNPNTTNTKGKIGKNNSIANASIATPTKQSKGARASIKAKRNIADIDEEDEEEKRNIKRYVADWAKRVSRPINITQSVLIYGLDSDEHDGEDSEDTMDGDQHGETKVKLQEDRE